MKETLIETSLILGRLKRVVVSLEQELDADFIDPDEVDICLWNIVRRCFELHGQLPEDISAGLLQSCIEG